MKVKMLDADLKHHRLSSGEEEGREGRPLCPKLHSHCPFSYTFYRRSYYNPYPIRVFALAQSLTFLQFNKGITRYFTELNKIIL